MEKLREAISEVIDNDFEWLENAGFEVSFGTLNTIAGFHDPSTGESFVLKLQRANTGREVKS